MAKWIASHNIEVRWGEVRWGDVSYVYAPLLQKFVTNVSFWRLFHSAAGVHCTATCTQSSHFTNLKPQATSRECNWTKRSKQETIPDDENKTGFGQGVSYSNWMRPAQRSSR